ncbi:MAG: PLP-dependent aminotransferase family protein [Humidesulfovibrio sp.]|uniref:aminotransferase-like domain-containing protein n=1 Tax=Humidesulfovibrio sp. TaxID=2910988 RepID=UPI0027337686|nr:PLP-dependent aminotransferase family protein [Humidesulfovibrio sp.]MDP2849221.1 PLP-dependent aminotransferase family protein [Humidesulfovibrio sp.]
MPQFADRVAKAQRSFIREILKVTADPTVISFAGGLPNPASFPVPEIAAAAAKVLYESGPSALQYSTTEGYLPLRQWIAKRYQTRMGMDVDPSDILITTGSQQALDLVAKVVINAGDVVVMEKPGYLGAIQAFTLFRPSWRSVPLENDGPDLDALEKAVAGAKLFYAVTSFQNPSGLSYSEEKRAKVAEILSRHKIFFLEDDPYGELRFKGQALPPVYKQRPENSMLLGTFSKVAAPGFRLGWIVAKGEIMERLIIAKQAADLHTGSLDQMIVHQFLADNDFEAHVERIRELYGNQCRTMQASIAKHFPKNVHVTEPEGGMFLWVTLPENVSAMDVLKRAVECKVAFVPGAAFFVDGTGENTLRLNYSNADAATIDEGIKRLAACLGTCMAEANAGGPGAAACKGA